jgi:hypothetical protein
MNLFSGFVPAIGTDGGWAYTHWVVRSYVAVELVEGNGLDTETFNAYSWTDEFNNPDWRKVGGAARIAILLLTT